MSEFSEILQKEEAQRQAVEKARVEVQAEIEKKKHDLALELSKVDLSQAEQQQVFEYKNQEMNKIQKAADEDFQKKLAEIKQREQTNFKAAVDYVLDALIC